MALSDEQIDVITLDQWGEMRGYPLAAHRAYARAIEAEVRKQDEALIRQMLDALEMPCDRWNGAQTKIVNAAVDAARLRLEGKP